MTAVEKVLDHLGSPADVLNHHGFRVRGRMARCPFHDDRDPSLSLFRGRDGKQRWKCHACNIYGDALDLEAMLSKRSVGEVLRTW